LVPSGVEVLVGVGERGGGWLCHPRRAQLARRRPQAHLHKVEAHLTLFFSKISSEARNFDRFTFLKS